MGLEISMLISILDVKHTIRCSWGNFLSPRNYLIV
jgi:hypothetical protein